MVDAAIDTRPESRPKKKTARSKNARRNASRLRSLARVVHPIPAEQIRDPLVRPKGKAAVMAALLVAGLVAAVAMHLFVLMLFYAAGAAFRAAEKVADPNQGPIEVAIVEPPPEPEPVVEPEPEPEPKPAEKPKPKKKKAKEPPPPDPIDQPKEKPKEEPKKTPRRIVGLSLESTVGGSGSGPAFAVGNTRMGTTDRKAEDPDFASKLPKEPAKKKKVKRNRRATRIPTASGPRLVLPRRKKSVKPLYPEIYRNQGIESSVTVRVTISKAGKVTSVDIVAPSKYPEFNASAKAAALKESFHPAMRGDKPVAHPITFTYWFTLDN